MLPPILLCRASSPRKVAMSISDHNNLDKVPPALSHSFPHPPSTPPPTDEATTYESVLTSVLTHTPTPTPTDVTDCNPALGHSFPHNLCPKAEATSSS